ncbi:hypothetical protein AX16_003437 [Volvariella volvacea WC 439]|nr:hypothetical protein AX16_003437 [Volvariella volvacea WC 439]
MKFAVTTALSVLLAAQAVNYVGAQISISIPSISLPTSELTSAISSISSEISSATSEISPTMTSSVPETSVSRTSSIPTVVPTPSPPSGASNVRANGLAAGAAFGLVAALL